MATKPDPDQHTVKITGPGLAFERPVSQEIANQIISLVMTGAASAGAIDFKLSGGNNAKGAAATGQPSPKQFMAQKRPSTDYERVACLALVPSGKRLEFGVARSPIT